RLFRDNYIRGPSFRRQVKLGRLANSTRKPSSVKSLLASIAFPAWCLGHDPLGANPQRQRSPPSAAGAPSADAQDATQLSTGIATHHRLVLLGETRAMSPRRLPTAVLSNTALRCCCTVSGEIDVHHDERCRRTQRGRGRRCVSPWWLATRSGI